MAQQKKRSLRGHLLIAAPKLRDPNFARTVVLVVQHDAQGALGFVLNRPMELPLSDLWKAIAGGQPSDQPPPGHAYQGGPVEAGALLVLHGDPAFAGDQPGIVPGVHLTNDLAVLRELVAGGPPERIRFYLGYSGWGAGQLDGEVARGDWFIAPARAEHVFEVGAPDLWRATMEALGGVYRLLALMPPNPELN